MDRSESPQKAGTILALLLITNDVPALFFGPDDLSVRPGSVISAFVGYCFLTYLVASHWRRVVIVLRHCLPLLLFIALTGLSAFWSSDPLLTTRKFLNLAMTVATGPVLVARFGWRPSLLIVVWVAALMVVASVLFAVVIPHIGIHQATDLSNAVHAGLWRGIFSHKNVLGHVASISLILSLFFGRELFGSPIRLIVMLTSMLCLVFARSGGAIAITLVVIGEYAIIRALVALPALPRAAAVLLSTTAIAPLAFTGQNIMNFALGALGKDPTLTGRTLLWTGVLRRAQDHLLIGAGYVAGFHEYRRNVLAAMGWAPFSAHNAFLEVLFGLGLLGLTLFIFMLFGYAWSASRLTLRDWETSEPLRFVPLLLFAFGLSYSLYESWLVFGGRDVLTMLFSTGYAACRAPLALNPLDSRYSAATPLAPDYKGTH